MDQSQTCCNEILSTAAREANPSPVELILHSRTDTALVATGVLPVQTVALYLFYERTESKMSSFFLYYMIKLKYRLKHDNDNTIFTI